MFLHSNIVRTKFTSASLRQSIFFFGILSRAHLAGADLTGAFFGNIVLHDLDFTGAIGLSKVVHRAPSAVTSNTLRRARTPEVLRFLARCGLNEIEVLFGAIWQPGLSPSQMTDVAYDIAQKRSLGPILVNPLFISYSHEDHAFVDRLQPELERIGIRCWRDVKRLTVGRIDTQIDRAIRLNPTVLVILSAASVRSDWVAWEAATARRVERELGHDVLCPIGLDDAWKECDWSAPLRQQIERYHVLDFSNWADDTVFRQQFSRLREGLRQHYNRPRI